MKILHKLSLLLIASQLASCAVLENLSKKPVKELDYLSGATKMNIKNFFDGNINASGIVQDSSGKIIGTYKAKIESNWDENKGVIKYNFSLNDKKDSRTWLITLSDDGSFEGIGHDVAKTAQGNQSGNAMRMIYSLSIKKDGHKEEVRYEDKVYLIDEKSAMMISKSNQRGKGEETAIISLIKN